MNKREFLEELLTGISGLPQEDIEERLNFYSEMIDDRMEEGLSESEAVSAIGPVKDVVAQILAETPITKLVMEKVRPRRSLRALEIMLLILGSPIWLSILIALFAVLLSVYITVWSVVIAMWSVEAAFAVSAVCGVVAAVVFALQGYALTGVAMLGAGICCAGLTILFAFVCKAITKGVIVLTGKLALGIKSLFAGKGTVK